MHRNVSMYDPLTARVVEVFEGSKYAGELLADGWKVAPVVTLDGLMGNRQELHYHGPNSHGIAWMCNERKGPRGGSTYHEVRVRLSGQVKTWVTRPGEFRVPYKYGMYAHGDIRHTNAHHFHDSNDCPRLVLSYQPAGSPVR